MMKYNVYCIYEYYCGFIKRDREISHIGGSYNNTSKLDRQIDTGQRYLYYSAQFYSSSLQHFFLARLLVELVELGDLHQLGFFPKKFLWWHFGNSELFILLNSALERGAMIDNMYKDLILVNKKRECYQGHKRNLIKGGEWLIFFFLTRLDLAPVNFGLKTPQKIHRFH